ncbi:dialkylrecorsinol condensing enzyme, partial [mine drainage metagenome]
MNDYRMKRRILVIHYSQSGQLSEVLRNFVKPLAASEDIELQQVSLQPRTDYPFPWPFLRFFDTFPETVYLDPPELNPLGLDENDRFDLIILGYQVWFLSPSLPTTAFLQSAIAHSLLRDTPVVTVITCRDMWLLAQEQTKQLLTACRAQLVGNVVLIDEAGSIGSFLATPIWMMTGKKGPRLGGLIPRAGVKEEQILGCQRFGERIERVLRENLPIDRTLLRNLNAVKVNTKLITTEH